MVHAGILTQRYQVERDHASPSPNQKETNITKTSAKCTSSMILDNLYQISSIYVWENLLCQSGFNRVLLTYQVC